MATFQIIFRLYKLSMQTESETEGNKYNAFSWLKIIPTGEVILFDTVLFQTASL